MKTSLTALAAAATVAVTAIATPSTAEARWWGSRGYGWRGPAFVGGLATGAFIGATFARPYAYGYGYGYAPYASYGYYGGPYASYATTYTYAAPVYTGYYVPAYVVPAYSCGYGWGRYGC
jgi:hypothetical protein